MKGRQNRKMNVIFVFSRSKLVGKHW